MENFVVVCLAFTVNR